MEIDQERAKALLTKRLKREPCHHGRDRRSGQWHGEVIHLSIHLETHLQSLSSLSAFASCCSRPICLARNSPKLLPFLVIFGTHPPLSFACPRVRWFTKRHSKVSLGHALQSLPVQRPLKTFEPFAACSRQRVRITGFSGIIDPIEADNLLHQESNHFSSRLVPVNRTLPRKVGVGKHVLLPSLPIPRLHRLPSLYRSLCIPPARGGKQHFERARKQGCICAHLGRGCFWNHCCEDP